MSRADRAAMTNELARDEDAARQTRRTRALLASGERVVIVSFGDSITAGYAVRRGFTYFWKMLSLRSTPGPRSSFTTKASPVIPPATA